MVIGYLLEGECQSLRVCVKMRPRSQDSTSRPATGGKASGGMRPLSASAYVTFSPGTKGSNLVSSSKESATNLTGKIEPALARNRRFESSSLHRRVMYQR
jgi:hypothetical protein